MNNTKTKQKTRLRFQVSKRTEMKVGYKILLYLGAILLAFVISAIFIATMGKNPFEFYIKLISGPFKNPRYTTLLIRGFIPLLITSLGISVAFKMKFWNIGAEGQYLIGALSAFSMAILLGSKLPSVIGIFLVLLAGCIGSGIYGGFVAVLKAKFNTNETLLTLMLNYVATYILTYFLNNRISFYVQSGNGIPAFKMIDKTLWLSSIKFGDFSIDTSLFFAIAILLLLWVYFRFTKQGYQISVVGDSPNTARYAGMKVDRIMIRTMFLSSALIGLAGALQLTGASANHTLGLSFTGGVGWTGIIVAWLAKLNPFGIALVSFLMALLEKGSDIARTSMGISAAVADVLKGIILFVILAFDFFVAYSINIRKEVVKPRNNTDKDTKAKEEAVEETQSQSCEVVLDNQELALENNEEKEVE